jgi:biopolymer transport protein ExbB/TolQ
MAVERLLSHIARALKIPVLVLAIVALAAVLAELGALCVELYRRRGRSTERLEAMLPALHKALREGDTPAALRAVRSVALTPDMSEVLTQIVLQLNLDDPDERIAKRLADYDYRHLRRLERTRILVRFGPALGLMGTLIPLSPALSGLAHGNVTALTNNLQVAFSVTVTGLLIGAVAFAISLVRDRMYGQDYSDVQYVAASLSGTDWSETIASATALLEPPGPAEVT